MKTLANSLVSLALLAASIYVLEWDRLSLVLRQVDALIFGLAVLLCLAIFMVLAVRWFQIIKPFAPLDFAQHCAYFFYSVFLNSFTPATVGGDTYRFVYLKSRATNGMSVVMAIVKERLCGVVAHLLAYLVCLTVLLSSGRPPMYLQGDLFLAMGGLALTVMVGVAIVQSPFLAFVQDLAWVSTREPVRLGLAYLKTAVRFQSVAEFVSLLGYSVVGIMVWALTMLIIAFDLRIDINWPALGTVVILTELLRLVPITFQGIGIREGAFAYLFQLLGVSPESGFVLALVGYLALSVAIVLCCPLSWLIARYAHSSLVR